MKLLTRWVQFLGRGNSPSQEAEYRFWRIGNELDDDTIVVFPEDGQVIHVVIFQYRGGTQHLVAATPRGFNEHLQGRKLGDQGADAGGPS